MEIKDVIERAFKIGNERTYLVRIYENKDLYIENTLTYMDLGLLLVNKSETIKRVDLILE